MKYKNTTLALMFQRQLDECDVVERLVFTGARRPHFQEKQVLVAIICQHLVINFGRNPIIMFSRLILCMYILTTNEM